MLELKMAKDLEFLLCYLSLENGQIRWYLINYKNINKVGFIGSTNLLEKIGEALIIKLRKLVNLTKILSERTSLYLLDKCIQQISMLQTVTSHQYLQLNLLENQFCMPTYKFNIQMVI
jgi:hypothetical protein